MCHYCGSDFGRYGLHGQSGLGLLCPQHGLAQVADQLICHLVHPQLLKGGGYFAGWRLFGSISSKG
ncbi:hypothetical protein JZU54_05990 [bacterium]|nr:hypothetical protein [bacterium]